jgi:hypothetical protein
LVEEARETSLHDHAFWTENVKLRNNPVRFISSGPSDPLEDPSTLALLDDQSDDQATPSVALQHNKELQKELRSSHDDPSHTSAQIDEAEEPTSFYFDTIGNRTTTIRGRNPSTRTSRRCSPDSSSSEEVILFRGRNSQVRENSGANQIVLVKEDHNVAKAQQHAQNQSSDQADLPIGPHYSKNHKHQRRKDQARNQRDDEDIVADYINNMRDNGELDSFFRQMGHNQRDLGGTDNEIVFHSDNENIECLGIRKKKSKQIIQDKGNAESCTQSTSEDTAAKGVEDDLVHLIAAQDLSSSSVDGSESDFSDTVPLRRSGADNQDEYDFMDWSTVAKQPKRGKGYRSRISFDHCDSDLEAQLQMAWKNDRLKKKERKKQREELRAIGLLRQNAKPDDLRAKYPSGISVEQVGEELQSFLQDGKQV